MVIRNFNLQMKVAIVLAIFTVMTAFSCYSVRAMEVNEKLADVLNTDIKVFINGAQIAGYNIDGVIYVIVEDLRHYDFKVIWNGSNRYLSVTRGNIVGGFNDVLGNTSKSVTSSFPCVYGDIITYINGKPVTSYSIHGATMIAIEKLAEEFGELVWDSLKRELHLSVAPVGFISLDAFPTTINSSDNQIIDNNIIPLSNMPDLESIETNITDLAKYADDVRQEFYRLVNSYRRSHGLRDLKVNSTLQKYADIRAAEQKIVFGHTRPDGSFAGSGWHNSKNFINTRYAENAISVHKLDPDPKKAAEYMFSLWKESESHNIHMLYDFNENITMALGIAPEMDSNGRITSGCIWASGY